MKNQRHSHRAPLWLPLSWVAPGVEVCAHRLAHAGDYFYMLGLSPRAEKRLLHAALTATVERLLAVYHAWSTSRREAPANSTSTR